VLANGAVPVSGVKQFVDYVKKSLANTPSAPSAAATAHFAGELVLARTGIDMTHVPYKGSAPAMTDLIGGQIPFSVDTVAAAIPQIKNGRDQGRRRDHGQAFSLLPDVPTFAEAGFKDIDMDTWLIVVGPKGMPANVKAKLEATLAEVAAAPDVQEKMKAQGFDPPMPTAPQPPP
jgi:tripartite-type tricarboxylate transporter receptor subunit TctC